MGGCTGCAALNSLPLNTKSATSGFHDDRGGGSSGPERVHTQLPTLPSPLLMQIKQDANMAVDTHFPRTLAFWRLLWHGAALQLPTILLFSLSTPPQPPLPYRPRTHRHSPPHSINTHDGNSVCTSIPTTTTHRLETTLHNFSQLCALAMLAGTRYLRDTSTRTTRHYTYMTHHHQPSP